MGRVGAGPLNLPMILAAKYRCIGTLSVTFGVAKIGLKFNQVITSL